MKLIADLTASLGVQILPDGRLVLWPCKPACRFAHGLAPLGRLVTCVQRGEAEVLTPQGRVAVASPLIP